MKKKNLFDELDVFSKFFQHCNYQAYKSSTDSDCYMLLNTGHHPATTIMLTPERVTIHCDEDKHFYSCKRSDWSPDFLEKCGNREGKYRNDYNEIARNFRSYMTLDVLAKYLVDECGMRIENERGRQPKICHLEQTVYDATSYFTLTISFRENRSHFDLHFIKEPFEDSESLEKKFTNMTDWSVETLERIGQELPIKILSDYMKNYKKTL